MTRHFHCLGPGTIWISNGNAEHAVELVAINVQQPSMEGTIH
jgi:hypothetical protein